VTCDHDVMMSSEERFQLLPALTIQECHWCDRGIYMTVMLHFQLASQYSYYYLFERDKTCRRRADARATVFDGLIGY